MVSDARSAGMRVAYTFELLEHILLDLVSTSGKPAKRGAFRQAFRNDQAVGIRTLLQCQQVTRFFQSTIANSQLLRRALFFEQPVPWDVSKGAKKNAVLLSKSWRVSQDIVVEVKVKWRMSKKGQRPKVILQVEPNYDPGKTADPLHSWRKMYFFSAECRVDSIRMNVPRHFGVGRWVMAEFVPQHNGSLTAGAIWEEVLGNADSHRCLQEYEAEFCRSERELVAARRCSCFRCSADERASIASTVRER